VSHGLWQDGTRRPHFVTAAFYLGNAKLMYSTQRFAAAGLMERRGGDLVFTAEVREYFETNQMPCLVLSPERPPF
jgi:hypothetical protein